MTKLIANLVGRNESHNYLRPILERLASQVDLITFTDDHSDDDTASIAESYGAKVMVMPEPTFNVHEGRLRQASWDHLEKVLADTGETSWFVLAIDCDEMLYQTNHQLRDLINQKNYDVISIHFYHMWNEAQYRVDKAWHPHGSTRLFRYFPNGVFNDRQLACGSEPTYVPQLARTYRYLYESGLKMKHLSYIKDADKQSKYSRYAKIDGGAFHANAHIESILDPNPVLEDWAFG